MKGTMYKFAVAAGLLGTTACLPGMFSFGGGGRENKKVVVTAATMGELVNRTGEKGSIGSLAPGMTEDPDALVDEGGGPRVNKKAATHARTGNVIKGGFSSLTFARMTEQYICFYDDHTLRHDEEHGEYELTEQRRQVWLQLTPWALYTVASPQELAAAKATWPAPANATMFEMSNLHQVFVTKDLQRVAVLELCAKKPPGLESGRFLVVHAHHEKAKEDLDRSFQHAYTDQKDERDKAMTAQADEDARFGIDSLAMWKLVGEAPAVAAKDPSARPAKPVKPGKRGEMDVMEDHPKVGETIEIRFSAPMTALPGEKYWITIVPLGAPDSAYGDYTYLDPDTTKAQVKAPDKPGLYDLRLHGNYPTKTTNLLQTVHLQVMK